MISLRSEVLIKKREMHVAKKKCYFPFFSVLTLLVVLFFLRPYNGRPLIERRYDHTIYCFEKQKIVGASAI